MTPTSTFRSSRRVSRAVLIVLLTTAAPVAAQDAQSNTTLPQTIPGLGNFSIAPRDRLSPAPLPSPTPTPAPAPSTTAPVTRTPVAPPPRLTIEPLPTPTPTPSQATPPRSRSTPAPSRTPAEATPAPAATPIPAAAPTPAAPATPTSVPSQPNARAPAPAPTSQAAAAPARPSKIWIVVLLAMLLLPGAMVAAWFYRRSQLTGDVAPAAVDDDDDEDWVAPAPSAAPAPVVPLPRRTPGSTARAQLEVAFSPRRAGTNLTSAAVDYELVVRNTGSAPAHGVRLSVDLITAGNSHDAELRALFDGGVSRPIVAPFELAPGEHKDVKAVAMLPKDAINVVSVKGRPMFVPMVAINILYDWSGGSGQTASSHVIGIARADGERMRPFWLDQAQRMHDGVSERAHAVTVRR